MSSTGSAILSLVDYCPCRISSPSTDWCDRVDRRSSSVRPASKNERSLDVLVAGTLRASVASFVV